MTPDAQKYREHSPGVFLRTAAQDARFDLKTVTRKGDARIYIDLSKGADVTLASLTFSGSGRLVVGARSLLRGVRLTLSGDDVAIRIGRNFRCGPTSLIAQRRDIEIGDNVLFSHGITVRTSDMHGIFDIDSGQRVNAAAAVTIADHVWIAQDVIVGKGVTIGTGSVVGAKALVVSDIGARTLAGGVPARTIRSGITWSAADDDGARIAGAGRPNQQPVREQGKPEMTNPRATLHVGMMKAASTTLQSVWAGCDRIDLVHVGLHDWMTGVRNRSKTESRQLLGRIVADRKAGRRPVVISHESLSGLNRRLVATEFARHFPDLWALVITRAPWDYVVSLYSKNLRHGHPGTIAEFVQARRNALRRTFDFDLLQREFADAAGIETVFVPFELIRTDPAVFYARIGAVVGAPLAPADRHERRNPTPAAPALTALAIMNRLAAAVMDPASKAAYDDLLYSATEHLGQLPAEQIAQTLAGHAAAQVSQLHTDADIAAAKAGIEPVLGNMRCLQGNDDYQDILPQYLTVW